MHDRLLSAFALVRMDNTLVRIDAYDQKEAIAWFQFCSPTEQLFQECRPATEDDVFEFQISEHLDVADLPMRLAGE